MACCFVLLSAVGQAAALVGDTLNDRPAAYEEGFMPVMEVYLVDLKKTVGLAPADINTGSAVVTPDQVDSIMRVAASGKYGCRETSIDVSYGERRSFTPKTLVLTNYRQPQDTKR